MECGERMPQIRGFSAADAGWVEEHAIVEWGAYRPCRREGRSETLRLTSPGRAFSFIVRLLVFSTDYSSLSLDHVPTVDAHTFKL